MIEEVEVEVVIDLPIVIVTCKLLLSPISLKDFILIRTTALMR